MHMRQRSIRLVGQGSETTDTNRNAMYINNHRLKLKGIGSEIGQSAQARISLLRCKHFLTCRCVCIGRSIMCAAKREHAHIGLSQLCQPGGNKTAVSLIRHRAIKKVSGLNKEVNALADREIGRLLKSRTQTLLPFFTLARRLTRGSITEMIFGGENNRDNLLLLPASTLLLFAAHALASNMLLVGSRRLLRRIQTICSKLLLYHPFFAVLLP